MPEQISQIIIIAGSAFVAMLVWAFSIAYVYLDSSRRRLSGGEQFVWMLLAALLPLIGFFAYLFARVLSRFISPESMTMMETRGSTLPRPVEDRNHTILALQSQQSAYVGNKEIAGDERTLSKTSQAYTLSIIEGPHTGEVFALDKLPAIIGRGSHSFIRLDDDLGVSRRHAELYELDGELHIKDLNSTHGIHVNGNRVDDRRLQTGDRVQIARSVLTVMINGVKDAN
jgi:hypothetical protein